METELDVPHRRSHMPAVHDREPSSYYASLRNPDGSLYQSLGDVSSDYDIPGLQKKKVSPDLGLDYENLGLNTIPV